MSDTPPPAPAPSESGNASPPKDLKRFVTCAPSTVDKDGKRRVVVSSISFDRDGDNMTVEWLNSMAATINSRKVPLYIDHGDSANFGPRYSVLDQHGYYAEAMVENNSMLTVTPVWRQNDPVADILQDMIAQGLPVSWSIGFIGHESEENERGGRSFKSGDLVEISAVGIPSNPDAHCMWKSVFSRKAAPAASITKDVSPMTDASPAREHVVTVTLAAAAPIEPKADDPKPEDKPEEKPEDNAAKALTIEAITEAFSKAAEAVTASIVASVKESIKTAIKELAEEAAAKGCDGDKPDNPDEEPKAAPVPAIIAPVTPSSSPAPKGLAPVTDAAPDNQISQSHVAKSQGMLRDMFE